MSIGSAIKSVVGSVAPTIATALGGPFAGVAMKFLAERLGVEDTGKVEEFLAAASENPGSLMELKRMEREFQQFMVEADIKLYELDVRDRESARDMASKQGLKSQQVLAAVYSVGYFGIFGLILTGVVDVEILNLGVVSALVGVLTAGQVQILNFFFGSSRGSKEKTELMARVSEAAGAPVRG